MSIKVEDKPFEPPIIDKVREYPIIVPNIELVGPRVLVMPPVRRETQTDAGIVIPESAQEFTQKGLVLLVGDGTMLENGKRRKPRVEPGWEIIYARYAGVELELNGTKYLIINESDIRCILTYVGRQFDPNKPPERDPS